MGAWETVKRVSKETWSQSWFKWGVFAGLLVIAVFLPLASSNPDGLEKVSEDLALYSDLLSYFTGIEFSALLPIYSYTISYALFPDYYIPQLYPLIIYELYYSSFIEIPQLVLYQLGEAFSGAKYLSSLLAGITGFFITLGSAWLVGLVLKKREPPT
ncbi:MAG: PDGLE domain-containing protein [Candidatus Jordarchaeum sp.]|uniref:PDGLE domain-containing protein n=1 Tax=Candidatus Jordarchaeum sp. TaxID=2823881 RepID=UPI004049E2CF